MQFRNLLKRYQKDTHGNFAISFAVVFVVLILGAGVAMDTNMMHSARSRLQTTADAAVLAAARSGETDQVMLTTIAANHVNANLLAGQSAATSVNLTASGRIQVNVNRVHPTQFMNIFGKPTVDIGVVSEAPLSSSEPVNISLVLDITGSMSGTKLSSLKTSATKLINTLDAYDNDSLKVSVVPFAQYVNVGLSRRNAVWLDVEDDSSVTKPEVCRMKRDVTSRTNCRRVSETRYNDGVPYTHTYTKCDLSYGPKYKSCYTPTVNRTWRGCVGSRTNPWHERVQYSGKKIPGLMNAWCGTEILPLTNDMNVVKAKINALSAGGNTYIPSGLAWGWRTLDTNEPLTEAAGPFAGNTDKVMVLMSDGANTKSKSGLGHNGNSQANANAVTSRLCTKIKAGEIQVYTIAYEITDVTTKNMMRNCATNSGMYFDASNSADLDAAFEEIGRNLIKLRLTH